MRAVIRALGNVPISKLKLKIWINGRFVLSLMGFIAFTVILSYHFVVNDCKESIDF